ncbi:M56 family metallopeptidase, partial [candidate division KSB1 bacterium]
SYIWTEYFLSWSVQNLIFLAMISCILYFFRNKDAKILYLISVIGLIKLLIPPFYSITGPGEIEIVNELFAGLFINTPKEMISDGLSFYMPLLSKKSIFMLIWLSFFSLMFLSAVYKGFMFRKILKGAVPADIEKLNIKDVIRNIPVLESRFDHSPLVIGFFKPRIVFPSCWKSWPVGCSRSVLAHEISHIKNGDRWINIIRHVAEALHFFNPLVWIIGKKLDWYREMACDDKATKIVKQPAALYSRHLLYISRYLSQQSDNVTATALFNKPSRLEKRIEYQLKRQPFRKNGKLTDAAVFIMLSALILPFSFDYSGRSVFDVNISRKGIKIERKGFHRVFPSSILNTLSSRLKRSIIISSNGLPDKDAKQKEKTDNTHTFYIETDEKVDFNVYNILGQRIRTHPEKQYPAGKIKYTFDGLDDMGIKVPQGIYIVRMKAENTESKTAKIIIN